MERRALHKCPNLCNAPFVRPHPIRAPLKVLLDVLHPGSGRRAGRWFTAPRAASSREVTGEGGSCYPIAIGSDDDARFVTVSRDVGSRADGARSSIRARSTASAHLPRPHPLDRPPVLTATGDIHGMLRPSDLRRFARQRPDQVHTRRASRPDLHYARQLLAFDLPLPWRPRPNWRLLAHCVL